jgi:hypothetical protein
MIMNMMRTAALLLLLSINGSNAIRGNKKSHLRELKNDQGPCGSISSELQVKWGISDVDCESANAERDDFCVNGLVASAQGSCETTKECSMLNPLESCIIVRDSASTALYTTVYGTVQGIALEYEIQTYSIKEICPQENIET